MEAESLLLVLELDHVAGFEKALQSYRGERVIFHGPSKPRVRTGNSIGHGTQVGVKASRLCVDQLVDRAARIVGEVLCVNSYDFSFVALMMIEEINNNGGVMGRKIEPIVVDPASNWPLFAEKARQLLTQDKVAVVFGCWTSVSRKSVLPVFEELNGLLSIRYSTRARKCRGMYSTPGRLRISRQSRRWSI
jgi:Periplasmic binding protein domain